MTCTEIYNLYKMHYIYFVTEVIGFLHGPFAGLYIRSKEIAAYEYCVQGVPEPFPEAKFSTKSYRNYLSGRISAKLIYLYGYTRLVFVLLGRTLIPY